MSPLSGCTVADGGAAVERCLEVLIVSTAVAPLGSGGGGGVELLALNLAKVLPRLGHRVTVLAPAGSDVGGQDKEHGFQLLRAEEGALEGMAQHRTASAEVNVSLGGALAKMWLEAARIQRRFDVILNLCFDWLPLYQTYSFATPIIHWLQMGSQSDPVDGMVAKLASEMPERLASYTRTQAMTFPCGGEAFTVLSMGIDLSLYPFKPAAGEGIAWAGRIAPEKGLEDAMAAVASLGEELHVFGSDENGELPRLEGRFPGLRVRHHGFLATADLAERLGRCRCLAMTPKWEEAFGIVAAEALACGLPVVAYARGGPAEIVMDGETGFLVEPDDVDALARGLAAARGLDRSACRRAALERFSLEGLAARTVSWFRAVLSKAGGGAEAAAPAAPSPEVAVPPPPEPVVARPAFEVLAVAPLCELCSPGLQAKKAPRRPPKEDSAASTTSTESSSGESMEAALTTVLRCVGEDPSRDGLLRTPHRFARAMEFLTSGYAMSLDEIVNDAIFEEDHHEMVVVKDIDVYSLCEHHMLPFHGKVHIAYIPRGKIIGLSKFARIVELFARRLQVQERLTTQIADTLERLLEPEGVGVVTECAHMCMAMRGVEKQGSTTMASAMRGSLKNDASLRQEFMFSAGLRR